MSGPDDNSDSGASSPAGRSRSGLGSRRVVWTAFAISAALHLWVIVVYPSLRRVEVESPVPFLVDIDTETPDGMEVIEVIEMSEEDPERPEEPEAVESVEAPAVDPGAPEVGGLEEPVLVAPGPTAAERLRPNLQDERVWAPIPPERFELTVQQRLSLELATGILQYRDSVAAAIAQAEGGSDWTYTDGEGRKWGISPGAIHLGDITIPLPNFSFGASDPMAQREVMRVWNEMQRQAGQTLMQDSWKERAQAIRARRDRERAAARPDTIGR